MYYLKMDTLLLSSKMGKQSSQAIFARVKISAL